MFFHAFANNFAQFEYNEGIEVSTESDNFPLNIIMSMHMPRCLKKEVSQRYTLPPIHPSIEADYMCGLHGMGFTQRF